MGVTVAWDNADKTVICLNFAAPWHWADYDCAVAQAQVVIQEVNGPVDVIMNLLRGPALPIGRPFAHLGSAVTLLGSRMRKLIIVGGDTSSRNILSMFFGMFFPVGQKLFLVQTLEAAQAILMEHQELRRIPFLNGKLPGMGDDKRLTKAPTKPVASRRT